MTHICYVSVFPLIKVLNFIKHPSGKFLLFSIQNSWKNYFFQSKIVLWCSQKYTTDQPIVWKLFFSNLCVFLSCFRDLKGAHRLRIFHFRMIPENRHTRSGDKKHISAHNWRLAPPKRDVTENYRLWTSRNRKEKLKKSKLLWWKW